MTERPADPASHLYKRHRFPAEIIRHAVWLYIRFPLSLRQWGRTRRIVFLGRVVMH